MYGYTMRINQPLETYRALHDAVFEIAGDDVKGLILHFAHATDEGFAITEIWQAKEQLDAFNRDVGEVLIVIDRSLTMLRPDRCFDLGARRPFPLDGWGRIGRPPDPVRRPRDR